MKFSTMAPLRLKKREDIRIKQGHVWIYSNEIDVKITPLSSFQPGQLVQIQDTQSHILGLGYVNPQTLLCARLLTRRTDIAIDSDFFISRIQRALKLREQLFDQPFYRLIYGEGDELPGLIIDRYGDYCVIQITTAGMEALKEILLSALIAVLKPNAVLWRNDHAMRQLEGLPEYVTSAFGDFPPEITLIENHIPFITSAWTGQKTGWFYDHRNNRAQLKHYVSGKRVLDLFSYVGGWGIQAAVLGAKEVLAIDSSAEALEKLQQNAKLNQVEDRVRTLKGDVFDQLKILIEQQTAISADQKTFDVIVLDPPALIKKRKDHTLGFIAYKRLNEMALRLLNPGGFLISASCSQHLSLDEFRQLLLASALKTGRHVQLLSTGAQGADHPLHLAIPEMNYLKTLFCHVT